MLLILAALLAPSLANPVNIVGLEKRDPVVEKHIKYHYNNVDLALPVASASKSRSGAISKAIDNPTQDDIGYAFDPLFWSSLIKWKDCPGVTDADKKLRKCQFPSTPQEGRITWTCPAGSFCVGQKQKVECTPGFYWYPVCPEGSFEAPKFAVLLVFVVVAVIVYVLFSFKQKADVLREKKRKEELLLAGRAAKYNDKPEIEKLKTTFDIEFNDLGLRLPNGIEIMKGVSGKLGAGRTCAIMGPSGAGKTTFVTLLSNKVKRTSGTVMLNGKPDELSNYGKLVGYVPQEDIMIRELTVRDILMHSARMRLPREMAYPQVKAKVNEIITFLGMSHIANSIIGNEEERGISGGQRKRVNIGMELVAEPSILFLDEPTSGLDSSTAFEVCSNLKQIARSQGLTVAAVIHSPSPATFRQFDDFLLLGKGGQVVYIGPVSECEAYFEKIGFTLPKGESPSDFYMDVASGFVSSEYDPTFKATDLFDYWNKRDQNLFAGQKRLSPEAARAAKKAEMAALAPAATQGDLKERKAYDYYGFTDYIAAGVAGTFSDVFSYLKDILTEFAEFCVSVIYLFLQKDDPVRNKVSPIMQTWFLMKRAYHQTYRNPQTVLVDLAMNFSAGIFISIAVQKFNYLGRQPWQQCNWAPINIQWRCFSAVDQIREAGMFVSLGVMFAGLSVSGNTFGREKVVYWRDTASGMSAVPYFLAKVVVDLPRMIIGAMLYSSALTIFFPYAQKFTTIYGVVQGLYFYAFAMGYALSIAVNYAKLAIYGTGMSLLWALVLSGVMPPLEDVYGKQEQNGTRVPGTGYPEAVSWLWNVSAPRYAIEAFWVREIQALPFDEKNRKADHQYDFNVRLHIIKQFRISIQTFT
ncbi:hypothetical protein HDV02_004565 [Globomyces sp. JEL0801]|nr:hypothetical protein HDV02_004565 [Globomyces sp. JEL0801]